MRIIPGAPTKFEPRYQTRFRLERFMTYIVRVYDIVRVYEARGASECALHYFATQPP